MENMEIMEVMEMVEMAMAQGMAIVVGSMYGDMEVDYEEVADALDVEESVSVEADFQPECLYIYMSWGY